MKLVNLGYLDLLDHVDLLVNEYLVHSIHFLEIRVMLDHKGLEDSKVKKICKDY